MKKIEWNVIIDTILMVIGFGLIWQFSNGWIVLGLILVGNVHYQNSIQPQIDELKKAKSELDALKIENSSMKQRIDFLYKTAYQGNND